MAETGTRRWLVVGALPSETAPLLAALSRPRLRGPRLIEGELGRGDHRRPVAVLTCGPGPERARAQTLAALDRVRVDAVLSVGTCGALIDGLSIGDLVCGQFATDPLGRRWPLRPLPGLRAVPVATVAAVVADPTARAALARSGHAICEMEAAAVAEAAQGLEVAALKVVSDLAGGAPDPVHDGHISWRSARILRFHARAARLCWQVLLPGLRAGLVC